jgi:hypothetical protein
MPAKYKLNGKVLMVAPKKFQSLNMVNRWWLAVPVPVTWAINYFVVLANWVLQEGAGIKIADLGSAVSPFIIDKSYNVWRGANS